MTEQNGPAKKICPILSAGQDTDFHACLESDCAWWLGHEYEPEEENCALIHLAWASRILRQGIE